MEIDSASLETFKHLWQLFDYAVLDTRSNPVGQVNRIWADNSTSTLKFIGLKTGWPRGQTHVIPAADARIDDLQRCIRVGFSAETIQGAPSHNSDVSLTVDQESKVYTYYDRH